MNMNVVTRTLGKIGASVIKFSPELLLAGGVVAIGVGTYLACKKTLELEKPMRKYEYQMLEIESDIKPETYTPKMQRADKARCTLAFVGDLAKLYWKPATCMIVGIGMIVGSHAIMTYRVQTLTGALAAMHAAYMAEKNANYSIETDEETGKKYVVKEAALEYADRDSKGRILPGPYSGWFDEDCSGWDRHSASITLDRVCECERMVNRKLDRWGVVYLNEAYEFLGMPRTDVGQVAGWWKDDPKRKVEFAPAWMLNCLSQEYMDFTKGNGGAPTTSMLLLDFKCDGPLLGRTPKEDRNYANTLRDYDTVAANWSARRRVLEADFSENGKPGQSLADYEAMVNAEMEAAYATA